MCLDAQPPIWRPWISTHTRMLMLMKTPKMRPATPPIRSHDRAGRAARRVLESGLEGGFGRVHLFLGHARGVERLLDRVPGLLEVVLDLGPLVHEAVQDHQADADGEEDEEDDHQEGGYPALDVVPGQPVDDRQERSSDEDGEQGGEDDELDRRQHHERADRDQDHGDDDPAPAAGVLCPRWRSKRARPFAVARGESRLCRHEIAGPRLLHRHARPPVRGHPRPGRSGHANPVVTQMR